MNDWKQHRLVQTIEAHRDGWAGAWDALVSAITRKPRLTVSVPVEFSVWVKGEAYITAAQMEHGKIN